MDDTKLATDVRVAVKALNDAVLAAAIAGINVDLDIATTHSIGAIDRPSVTAKLRRVLVEVVL